MPNKRRSAVPAFDHGEPLLRASSLPAGIVLISVFAALLPLLLARPHVLLIDLPVGNPLGAQQEAWPPNLPIHRIETTRFGEILWDGEAVTPAEMIANVDAAKNEIPRPGIVFAPEGEASYDLSAKTLNLLTRAGATDGHFCLGGLAAYQYFDRGMPLPRLFLTIYMPQNEAFEPGVPPREPECDGSARPDRTRSS